MMGVITVDLSSLIAIYQSGLGVHTVKIIWYGTVPVFFIRFRYANSIDTGYFLYFVNVFEILSRALVLGKVWWGWTSTM